MQGLGCWHRMLPGRGGDASSCCWLPPGAAGHCLPSSACVPSGMRVAWPHVRVAAQSELRESRIKKLESIGFSWELHMDWDSRMQQLRVFKAKYGHCNVPQQIKMNGKGRVGTCSLGTWVTMSPSPRAPPRPPPCVAEASAWYGMRQACYRLG